MKGIRPGLLTAGIILVVIYGLINILFSLGDFIRLVSGQLPAEYVEAVPPFVIYGSALGGIVGVVGAVGLWMLRRWGLVVAVIGVGLNALLAAPGVFFAPEDQLKVAAAVGVALGVVIIVLLMLPSQRRALA